MLPLFHPSLPEDYRESEIVFLANIDPDLQMEVLNQTKSPALTVLDSMNYWISGKKEALTRVMSKVDIVLLNEAEVRQYAGTYNLLAAARQILCLGPKALIIKKGEYGALMIADGGEIFIVPAYLEASRPRRARATPSRADFWAISPAMSGSALRVSGGRWSGSVIASFTVEDFSVNRLLSITRDEIEARYQVQAVDLLRE